MEIVVVVVAVVLVAVVLVVVALVVFDAAASGGVVAGDSPGVEAWSAKALVAATSLSFPFRLDPPASSMNG